jgi:hypothetical protein
MARSYVNLDNLTQHQREYRRKLQYKLVQIKSSEKKKAYDRKRYEEKKEEVLLRQKSQRMIQKHKERQTGSHTPKIKRRISI